MTTPNHGTTTHGKAAAKPSTHRYLTEGYRPTVRGVPTPKKVPKLVSGVTTASSSHGK